MTKRLAHPRLLILALATIFLVGVGVGAVLLIQELGQVRTDLDVTRGALALQEDRNDNLETSLQASETRNQELQTANEMVSGELTASQDRNSTLTAANEALVTDLQSSTTQNTDLTTRVEHLEANLEKLQEQDRETLRLLGRERETTASLTGELESERKDNADLTRELEAEQKEKAALMRDLGAERSENAALQGELETERSENAALQGELEVERNENAALGEDLAEERLAHGALMDAVGGLEKVASDRQSLEDRVTELRAEIERLEEMRRPLLVDSRVTGLACTGSMEPKLTCLDSVTWLNNFNPEDIEVGTFIRFKATDDCDSLVMDEDVAHIVLEIKVENGVHHYWPAGDANEEPDGCWIPEERVDGYMIGLDKDAHPENAQLRSSVNSAEASYKEADRLYAETHKSYCGVAPGTPCNTSDSHFQELLRLHARSSAYFESWTCWLDSAANAIYRDGQSPIYLSCLPPIIPQGSIVSHGNADYPLTPPVRSKG